MNEEFTELMHYEFKISNKEAIKQRSMSALDIILNTQDEEELLMVAEIYNVSVADIKRNQLEYSRLKRS